jgi:hypothetical protein
MSIIRTLSCIVSRLEDANIQAATTCESAPTSTPAAEMAVSVTVAILAKAAAVSCWGVSE